MKDGPQIAHLAALIGDPARANMMTALIGGQALTAAELAAEAGITPQTASSHLAKLQTGGLIVVQRQGRHHYHRLAGSDVAHLLETLMGVAARSGTTRLRPGPKEPAMRKARICYDHLAGELGVRLFESLLANAVLEGPGEEPALTGEGRRYCADFGIDLPVLERRRRPLCRSCLDWSVRRCHLAGGLGAAFLMRFFELNWARREVSSRVVRFSADGERRFLDEFQLPLP